VRVILDTDIAWYVELSVQCEVHVSGSYTGY